MLRSLNGQKGHIDRLVERLKGKHDFERKVTAVAGIVTINRSLP
jgi:hypothetical protein